MKQIQGYDNYTIDREGVIYSKRFDRTVKVYIRGNGYPVVSLSKDNRTKNFYMHRLLAIAYLPNPDNLPEVNHIDSNRENYSLSNLEWVSRSDNQLHAYAHGSATKVHKRKLTEEEYLEVFELFLKGVPFAKILESFPVSPGRLSINLRSYVKEWGRLHEYSAELQRQRVARARRNISKANGERG